MKMTYEAQIGGLKGLVKSMAPDLPYHNAEHMYDVSEACRRYGEMESLDRGEIHYLETAGLLHDIVFVPGREDNEEKSAEFSEKMLPLLGYSQEAIDAVSKLIIVTKPSKNPQAISEMVIRDADLDYLGRSDYFEKAKKLRREVGMDKDAWYESQLSFLETVDYYTKSAQQLRGEQKQRNYEKLRRCQQKC